jgi:hypothetical protein
MVSSRDVHPNFARDTFIWHDGRPICVADVDALIRFLVGMGFTEAEMKEY